MLEAFLPFAALFRFLCTLLRRGRSGAPVPLVTPCWCGCWMHFCLGRCSCVYYGRSSVGYVVALRFRSLLVEVYNINFLEEVSLYLQWILYHFGMDGMEVPLVNSHCWCVCWQPPALGGVLAFDVNYSPSDAWWTLGSALFLLYISIVYYMCRKEV